MKKRSRIFVFIFSMDKALNDLAVALAQAQIALGQLKLYQHPARNQSRNTRGRFNAQYNRGPNRWDRPSNSHGPVEGQTFNQSQLQNLGNMYGQPNQTIGTNQGQSMTTNHNQLPTTNHNQTIKNNIATTMQSQTAPMVQANLAAGSTSENKEWEKEFMEELRQSNNN